MLTSLLVVVALLSGVLMLWQWVAGARFPMNRRRPVPSSLPSVTLLKPVKGADPGTATALASWLSQDYPGLCEVLFGVEADDDPAADCVRSLLAKHPAVRGRLLICPERLGINRKVSNLIQLAREATGDHLVISDADVSAPRDLVAQLIAPLADPAIGLTHCLYRFADPTTPATRWEAFAVNADFWSQVLQNRTLGPLKYALGAAMAFRQADLAALGGFDVLADDLADDHLLGRRIVALGKRTELCPVVVDCHVAPAGWMEVWRHQLRWAVTIRVCQPLPHFLSILANGTVWPLLAAACAPGSTAIAWVSGGLLFLRVLQGLALEARFTGRPRRWSRAWLPWFKDLVQVALWSAALLKRHVRWRGHRYRVLRNGRLVPAPDSRLKRGCS